MLQAEAATVQKQLGLSAEQLGIVKGEIKKLLISSLGLGQAEERQAKEAKVRSEHITALEVKTRTLKMRMDELTAQRQLLESKADMSDQDKEQIASMRTTTRSYQTICMAPPKCFSPYRLKKGAICERRMLLSEK